MSERRYQISDLMRSDAAIRRNVAGGEHVIVTRRKRPLYAIVPVADLAAMNELAAVAYSWLMCPTCGGVFVRYTDPLFVPRAGTPVFAHQFSHRDGTLCTPQDPYRCDDCGAMWKEGADLAEHRLWGSTLPFTPENSEDARIAYYSRDEKGE